MAAREASLGTAGPALTVQQLGSEMGGIRSQLSIQSFALQACLHQGRHREVVLRWIAFARQLRNVSISLKGAGWPVSHELLVFAM